LATTALTGAPAASAAAVLTPVPGSPFSTGANSAPIAVAFRLDGQQLATANQNNNTMSLFNVAANGSLTQVQGSPVATGSLPNGIAASPSALLFAVANTQSDGVSVFSGTFQVSGSPFTDQRGPMRVAFSPNGQFLALADYGSTVSMFSVGANAALTPVPGSPFNNPSGNTPGSISFSPNGKLLAVADLGGDVTEFSVAANGALATLSGTGTAVANHAAYSPSGQFLAGAALGQPGLLGMYSVAADGALNEVGPILHPQVDPWSVAFSPDGQLLAVGSYNGGSVDLYSVSATGGLTLVSGSPFQVGSGPESLAFNPSGTLLAVTNNYGNNVSVFAVAAPSVTLLNNHFSISRVRVHSNGRVTLRVNVPGPGTIKARVTVAKSLVVGRTQRAAHSATTLRLMIRPSGHAVLTPGTLLALHVTFTPSGGHPRRIVRRGLPVP
jgi:6-phosphogluconolactonase (cycloisomerase 2 family)